MAQKHNEEMISAPMTRYGRLTLEAQRRQLRSDAFTADEWAINNPILQLGELGSEKDTNKIKVGDGVTAWNDLPYSGGGSEGQTIQVEELPEASADELGNIYQFIGTTGDTYTNGYFYKCTGAGEPVVYSWSQVDVQPAPEALPDQTGQSGKFLTTDGTDASWGTINALQNKAAFSSSFSLTDMPSNKMYCTVLGIYASAGANAWGVTNASAYGYSANVGDSCTCIGASTQAGSAAHNNSKYNIAIGTGAKAATVNNVVCAIQIGAPAGGATNNDANTLKVGNANGNFEMMSADGTIPAARHASLPAADGTYVLKLTISGGVPTLAWVAE